MQDIAFKSLVHGVYVVTTRCGDRVNGMIASWVSQVSLSPLLLMVSIAPARYSHDLIKESRVFAINVLTSDQVDLGKRFGFQSGRRVDKFAGLDYLTAKTGSPILPQAQAYFDLSHVKGSSWIPQRLGALERKNLLVRIVEGGRVRYCLPRKLKNVVS